MAGLFQPSVFFSATWRWIGRRHKAGISRNDLDEQARPISDNDAARHLNETGRTIVTTINGESGNHLPVPLFASALP